MLNRFILLVIFATRFCWSATNIKIETFEELKPSPPLKINILLEHEKKYIPDTGRATISITSNESTRTHTGKFFFNRKYPDRRIEITWKDLAIGLTKNLVIFLEGSRIFTPFIREEKNTFCISFKLSYLGEKPYSGMCYKIFY